MAFEDFGFGSFGPRPRDPVAFPPYTPDQEEPILTSLGHNALAGLGWIGSLLDKTFGGRAVRGVLGGKPQEALSILPFSDTLGITNPSDITYGSELLGGNKDTPLFSPEGLAGLGVEMALDPATYLTFGTGAVNKLGQAARKAGVLPKSLVGRLKGLEAGTSELERLAGHLGVSPESIAGAPLGGIAGIKAPFSREAPLLLGEGRAGQSFLDTLSKGWNAAKSVPVIGGQLRGLEGLAGPLSRRAAALFDKSVKGAIEPEVQKWARTASEAESAGRMSGIGAQQEMYHQLAGAGVGQLRGPLRAVAENANLKYLPEIAQTLKNLPAEGRAAIEGVAGRTTGEFAQMVKELEDIGIDPKVLDDMVEYYPRQMTPGPETVTGAGGTGGMPFSTFSPSDLSRMPELRNLPGGTEAINKMMRDPEIADILSGASGRGKLAATHKIRSEIVGLSEKEMLDTIQETNALGGAGGINNKIKENKALIAHAEEELAKMPNTPATAAKRQMIEGAINDFHDQIAVFQSKLNAFKSVTSRMKQSEHLTDIAKSLTPKYAAGPGQDIFGNHPLHDYLLRRNYHEKTKANAQALLGIFGDTAKFSDTPLPGHVSLADTMKRSGFAKGDVVHENAVANFIQSYYKSTGDLITPDQFKNMQLPKRISDDVSRMMGTLESPKALKPVMDFVNKVTNLTKSYLTVLWPANLVRNFYSGIFQNWVTGVSDPALYQKVFSARNGNVIEGLDKLPAFRGLDNKQATQKFLDWTREYGLHGRGQSIYHDIPGQATHDIMDAAPDIALAGQKQPGMIGSYLEGWKDLGKNLRNVGAPGQAGASARARINPLNIEGVRGESDLFGPIAGGRRANQIGDEINREVGFLGRLEQGYDPMAAAIETKAAHYDYSDLSKFERTVLRPIFPFYNWIRHNTPFVVNEIMRNPGGKIPQLIRGSSRATGDESKFIPDWLSQGVTAPLGGPSHKGTQKFLSGLGLPFEDLGHQLSVRGVLGAMNPAFLKFPLELATGRQFFTGRDLVDLNTITGNTTLDQAIMNSPLSRFFTTYQKATDPRKDFLARLLNVGTGVRISDVDMERARNAALRDYLQEQMRGHQNIQQLVTPYVRQEDIPDISPFEQMLLRLEATRLARIRNQR